MAHASVNILEAGRRAIAEWERDHGPLTPDELANGLSAPVLF